MDRVMSNLHEHAMMEFKAAGWLDDNDKFKDEMQEMICNHVLKLIDLFSEEGHSGSSAPYAIDLFKKLAMFEPIVPLTGEDWEWFDHGYCKQNKRCSHVFKQDDRFDGQPYDIDGIVFWDWQIFEGEPFKSYYTSGDSHTVITFPYNPQKKYQYRHPGADGVPQTEEGIIT